MRIGPLPKARGKRSPKTWRNLGDKLLSQFFRGQPCAVCGKLEGVCGHHILHKSRYNEFRFTLENLIPLCMDHHRFSNELAAHSDNTLAQAAFIAWLKEAIPDQWAWADEHSSKHVKGNKPDWEEMVLAMHKRMQEIQANSGFSVDTP